jgi:tetratricopeptide (TPR) repeat protein
MARTDEAVERFQRAVDLSPQWSLPWYNLGLAYAKQGRFKETEAALQRALSLNREDPDIYSSLSRLLLEQKRFAEALRAAEAAIKRRPGFVWAHFNRAWALEGLGRFQEAASGYEHVLVLDSTLGDVKRKLISVQQRMAANRKSDNGSGSKSR